MYTGNGPQNVNRNWFNDSLRTGCVVVLCIVQLIALFVNANRDPAGIRMVNYIFFAVGIILFFLCSLSFKVNKNDLITPIVLAIYYILYSIIFSVNFDCTIKYINFFLMVSVWVCGEGIKVTKELRRFLGWITFFQGMMLVAFYYGPNAYAPYTEYTITADFLTLGFSNPNETAMIIFCVISLLIIFVSSYENRYIKIVFALMIGYLAYLLFLTDARTSLIGTAVVLLWYCFMKSYRIRNLKCANSLVFLIIIVALLFVPMYLWLFNHSGLGDIRILGKKLFSGRQRVFLRFLLNWENVLFGDMNRMYFSNAHNGLFTILLNTGIVGTLIYTQYIIHILCQLNRQMYEQKRYSIAMVCILAIYIMSSGEAAVLVEGNIFYFYILLFSVLCNSECAKPSDSLLRESG